MDALKQAQKDGVVLGLKNVSGVLPRKDVDVLLKEQPDTFNLFLLALEALQLNEDSNTKQAIPQDKMGYFQVAGIHGYPLKAWDNVRDPGSNLEGSYCPHGTVFFPTWHRPYIAMMEQSVYHKMDEIAGKFQDTKRWKEAAQKFRFPYWDYYRPRGKKSVFPGVKDPVTGTTSYEYDFSMTKALTVPEIMVYRPGAEKEPQPMKNPLYSYEFPKNGIPTNHWDRLDASDRRQGLRFSSRKLTVRHPAAERDEKSDAAELNRVLVQERAPSVEALLNMILWPIYDDYAIFSNASSVDADVANGSLEGLHGNYHFFVGGHGHMTRVPVSAFDPVFWLHHCNIDRIFAIWQATHDSWFPRRQDAAKSLYPFRSEKSNAKFWSSDGSRDLERFGYTYPDIAGLKDRAEIRERFNRKYRWSLKQQLRPQVPDYPTPDMEPIDVMTTYFFQFKPRPINILPPTDNPVSQQIASVAASAVETSKSVAAPVLHAAQNVMGTAKTEDSKESKPEGEAETAAGDGATSSSQVVTTNPPAPLENPAQEPFGLDDKQLLAKQPEGTQMIRQWFVDSVVQRSAYNGSFTIFYFIGNFEDSPDKYVTEPTLAGINHVFVAPTETCANCELQAEEGALAYDTNPITPMLLDYIENKDKKLKSLHPDDVVPFLKANLHWRVVGVNSVPLKPEDVKLKVSVSATLSYVRPGSTIPEYDSGTTYPEVTGESVR